MAAVRQGNRGLRRRVVGVPMWILLLATMVVVASTWVIASPQAVSLARASVAPVALPSATPSALPSPTATPSATPSASLAQTPSDWPTVTASGWPTATPSDWPASTPNDASETGTQPRTIVFIGDSWLRAVGAEPAEEDNSWGAITARRLGWPYMAFAGSGTGYTKDNKAGEGPYADRVDFAIAADADVVVVQGSSNDHAASGEEIEAAATSVFVRLRLGLPRATIFALGAMYSPGASDEKIDISAEAVRSAAATTGVTYVDGMGWLDSETDFADGLHPNNSGYAKVAEQLAAVIRDTVEQP